MLRRLNELAQSEQSFAFESTLSSRSFAHFLSTLKQQGYRVDVCYVWLHSAALAKERVKLRVQMGGHHIPPEVIERRYLRSIHNFKNLYLPLADAWSVFDNSIQAKPKLIAQSKNQHAPTIYEEAIWKIIQAL